MHANFINLVGWDLSCNKRGPVGVISKGSPAAISLVEAQQITRAAAGGGSNSVDVVTLVP